jgi:hypothetical protein
MRCSFFNRYRPLRRSFDIHRIRTTDYGRAGFRYARMLGIYQSFIDANMAELGADR